MTYNGLCGFVAGSSFGLMNVLDLAFVCLHRCMHFDLTACPCQGEGTLVLIQFVPEVDEPPAFSFQSFIDPWIENQLFPVDAKGLGSNLSRVGQKSCTGCGKRVLQTIGYKSNSD